VRALIAEAAGGQTEFIDATTLATRLCGDAIATNLFILGLAFQKGLVPLSSAALLQAIEINGVAVRANQAAFSWGRRAALDLPAVERLAAPAQVVSVHMPRSLSGLIAQRVEDLTRYQDKAYARDYLSFVEDVRATERRAWGSEQLTRAVATNLYKLMAYKDEYEVARLYSDGSFARQLAEQFEGTPRLTFHMAPPVLGQRDANGKPMKQSFSAWMGVAFKVLALMRFLRHTRLDPFGRSEERRFERGLVAEYRRTIAEMLPRLAEADMEASLALARLPSQIRGYGHVKQQTFEAAAVRREELVRKLFKADVRGARETEALGA